MIQNAQVAELVDAHVSGACAARRAGSSPVLGTLFYFFCRNAEIAQLVEHNLAKVGVAGPSPVFRSFFKENNNLFQMNLYLRYFDRETLVSTVDEALDFLRSIDEIEMTPLLEADIREYAESDIYYPKRYKVHPRVYFIIIKTDAATMQDFKEKKAVHPINEMEAKAPVPALVRLNELREGWYEGVVDFKRVLLIPATGKFQYRDTQFVARVKASSGMECYERIIDHLRDKVDERSQFPSAKGKNFKFRYLGKAKDQVNE